MIKFTITKVKREYMKKLVFNALRVTVQKYNSGNNKLFSYRIGINAQHDQHTEYKYNVYYYWNVRKALLLHTLNFEYQ